LIKDIAKNINEGNRRFENEKLTIELKRKYPILSDYVGDTTLIQRYLIKQGKLYKITKINKYEVDFYLFTDVILIVYMENNVEKRELFHLIFTHMIHSKKKIKFKFMENEYRFISSSALLTIEWRNLINDYINKEKENYLSQNLEEILENKMNLREEYNQKVKTFNEYVSSFKKKIEEIEQRESLIDNELISLFKGDKKYFEKYFPHEKEKIEKYI
jgi:hypothetical protein